MLQISDSVKLFEGADRIQSAAAAGLQAQGYSVSASLGPTPSAPRSARGPAAPARALRQASRRSHAEPEGALVLGVATQATPPRTPACSQPLSQGRDGQTARRPWPSSPGALRALPAALQARLGQEARDRLEQFWGTKPDLRPALKTRRAFYRDQPFLEDAVHRGGLRFPLRRVCGELAQWLRDRQLRTDRLSWRLQHRDHGSQYLRVVLADPQGSAEAFYELSWLQLSRAELLPAVDRLTLRVTSLSPCEGPGEDLFQSAKAAPRKPHKRSSAASSLAWGKTATRGSARRTILDPNAAPPPFAPAHPKPPGSKSPAGRMPRSPTLRRRQLAPQPPAPLAPPRPQRLSGARAQPRYRGKTPQLRQGPERLCYGWWDHTAEGPGTPRDYQPRPLRGPGYGSSRTAPPRPGTSMGSPQAPPMAGYAELHCLTHFSFCAAPQIQSG